MIFTDSQVNKLVLNRNSVCKSIINPESTHRVNFRKNIQPDRDLLLILFNCKEKNKNMEMSPQGFYEVEKLFQITDTIATINNSKRKGFKNIFHSGLIRENEKKRKKLKKNEIERHVIWIESRKEMNVRGICLTQIFHLI